jgi:hypothetical protein
LFLFIFLTTKIAQVSLSILEVNTKGRERKVKEVQCRAVLLLMVVSVTREAREQAE